MCPWGGIIFPYPLGSGVMITPFSGEQGPRAQPIHPPHRRHRQQAPRAQGLLLLVVVVRLRRGGHEVEELQPEQKRARLDQQRMNNPQIDR